MSTLVAARAESDISNHTPCACRSLAAPDITDLPNRSGGPCVLCRKWVMKRAGWRVRGRGRWLGVACDGHDNPALPVRPVVGPPQRPSVAERAEQIARRVAAGDKPAWAQEQLEL